MVKSFLIALFFGVTASAQISNVDRAVLERGRNLLTNGGFESGRASWTASGGTFTTTVSSSEVGLGAVSGVWDSNAAAQTLRTALITIPEGLKGQNGEFYCRVQTPSGTATHTIEVNDGTNIISRTNLVSSTTYTRTGNSFIFPSSGQIRLEIDSVASNEPSIRIDDCYLGSPTNIGTVAQATLYATATQAAATGCNYAENTSTGENDYITLGTSTGCNSWTTTGNITPVGTNSHQMTLTNLPPGQYEVSVLAPVYSSASGQVCNWRFNDGTTSFGYGSTFAGSTQVFGSPPSGVITYTSTQSSVTFRVQAADAGAGSCYIANEIVGRSMIWVIKRFPSSSETVYQANTTAWKVDANISGANASLGSSDLTTYTGIEDASLTLTNNSGNGNIAAQIGCSSTNSPSGTTCSSGSESVSVSFTPPGGWTGDVLACVSFSHYMVTGAGGTIESIFQIVETATNAQTVIQEGKSRISSSTITASQSSSRPHRLCGTFTFSSSGQKMLRLMYEQDVTATVSANIILADAAATLGNRDIHWEVYPINQQVPAPVFIGSVTSNSSGAERVERVTVSNPGTPSTSSQSGSWVTGYVDNGVGDITVNFATGIFSNTPTCVSNTAANSNITCTAHAASTSNVSVVCRTANTAATADSSFNLLCMGPR